MVAARGLAGGAACAVGDSSSKERLKSKVKVKVKPSVRAIVGRVVVRMIYLLSDAGSGID
jgi:hypothetical protein